MNVFSHVGEKTDVRPPTQRELFNEDGHKIVLAAASTNDAVVIAKSVRCLRMVAETADYRASLTEEGALRDMCRAARRDGG